MVFKIFGHFLLQGINRGWNHHVMSWTNIPLDVPWHKKQEYVWFRDVDINHFQDIRAFPVSGGMGPLRMVMTYIPSDVLWHKNQGYRMYG
jgi:hypothetical protein